MPGWLRSSWFWLRLWSQGHRIELGVRLSEGSLEPPLRPPPPVLQVNEWMNECLVLTTIKNEKRHHYTVYNETISYLLRNMKSKKNILYFNQYLLFLGTLFCADWSSQLAHFLYASGISGTFLRARGCWRSIFSVFIWESSGFSFENPTW